MPTTSFSVTTPSAAAATGYVQSDGFVSPTTAGTPVGSDGGHVKGPALFPYGFSPSQGTVAAAGASSGNATVITAAMIKVTATASTEGIKGTTAFPVVFMNAPGSIGFKLYPPTGHTLNALSTNTAISVATTKGAIMWQVTATNWMVLKN